jgi:N-acetylglucosamine kinase-like BadF-type ATPase
MAGAREGDRRRIREAAGQAWPGCLLVGNDLETALAAAEMDGGRGVAARVVIISGTGSCCYGRNAAGRNAKVGGWGHLLGTGQRL